MSDTINENLQNTSNRDYRVFGSTILGETALTTGDDTREVLYNTPPSIPSFISIPVELSGVIPGDQFTIAWEASEDSESDEIEYILERKMYDYWAVVYEGGALSYTETVGSNWPAIQYRIKARDIKGNECGYFESEEINVSYNKAPGNVPSITVPDFISLMANDEAAIEWGEASDPEDDEITYVLERTIGKNNWRYHYSDSGLPYTDTFKLWEECYTGPARQFTDTLGDNWETVQYRVRAVDAVGNKSNYLESEVKQIIYNTPPGIPPAMEVSSLSGVMVDDEISIEWEESEDADNDAIIYQLEKRSNGGEWAAVYIDFAHEYTDTVEPDLVSLEYRVKALDTRLNESGYRYSGVKQVIYNTPPSIPGNLTVPSPVRDYAETAIAWNASVDADNDTITYILEHNVGGSSWEVIYSGYETIFREYIQTSWQSIQYRIKAVDNRGNESNYNTGAVFTILHDTAPSPVVSITIPELEFYAQGDMFDVAWEPVVDSEGDTVTYQLERSINELDWETVYLGIEPVYADTVNGLWDTVQYRIKAVDNYGLSSSYTESDIREVLMDTSPTLELEESCVYFNIENASDPSMEIIDNTYLVILTDKYYNTFKKALFVYTALLNAVIKNEIIHFTPYQVPLAAGRVTLLPSLDERNTFYIAPKEDGNTPVIQCKIKSRDVFAVSLMRYLALNYDSAQNEMKPSWIAKRGNLYNPINGLKLPLESVIEQKLPYQFMVSKSEHTDINFVTYKNYIYTITSTYINGNILYYLHKINRDTLQVIESNLLEGTGGFTLPLDGSVISINLSGDIILIAGGVHYNNTVNTILYTINIKNHTVSSFSYCDIYVGVHAAYFEMPNENSVHIFSKNSSKIYSILINESDNNTVDITLTERDYNPLIMITHVLMQIDWNTLRVLGKLIHDETSLYMFDIDIKTGKILNTSKVDLPVDKTITAIIPYGNKSVIINFKNSNKNVIQYVYNAENNNFECTNTNLASVTADGIYKIDGVYERDDLIGMKVSRMINQEDAVPLYRIRRIYPDIKTDCSISIGNFISACHTDKIIYNERPHIKLLNRYDIRIIGKTTIKMDKITQLLDIITYDGNALTVPCQEILWAAETYKDELIVSVRHTETLQTIYYINLYHGITAASMAITPNHTSIYLRKTSEIAFMEAPKRFNDDACTLGILYLAGGESGEYYFQDILELKFVINPSQSTLNFVTRSILPSVGEYSYGSYKAKLHRLSNSCVAVAFGITLVDTSQIEQMSRYPVRINKNNMISIIHLDSEYIHYIQPNQYYGVSLVSSLKPYILSSYNSLLKGEVIQSFVTANYVYFIMDHNAVFACEIDASPHLSNFVKLDVSFDTSLLNTAVFTSEINKNITGCKNISCDKAFTVNFKYYIDILKGTSKFERGCTYQTNIDNLSVTNALTNMQIIDILLLENKISHLLLRSKIKNYNYMVDIKSTRYRLDAASALIKVDKNSSGVFTTAFIYDTDRRVFIRKDSSYFNGGFAVAFCNGKELDKYIEIMIPKGGAGIEHYKITGNDSQYPFEYDILPSVIGFEELAETQFPRFLIFTDSRGFLTTFDCLMKTFIRFDGIEQLDIPFLSGELTILPSKVIEQGSIGKRVWAYSNHNPYLAEPDAVSIEDTSLI
jgi:hypothetical protein